MGATYRLNGYMRVKDCPEARQHTDWLLEMTEKSPGLDYNISVAEEDGTLDICFDIDGHYSWGTHEATDEAVDALVALAVETGHLTRFVDYPFEDKDQVFFGDKAAAASNYARDEIQNHVEALTKEDVDIVMGWLKQRRLEIEAANSKEQSG